MGMRPQNLSMPHMSAPRLDAFWAGIVTIVVGAAMLWLYPVRVGDSLGRNVALALTVLVTVVVVWRVFTRANIISRDEQKRNGFLTVIAAVVLFLAGVVWFAQLYVRGEYITVTAQVLALVVLLGLFRWMSPKSSASASATVSASVSAPHTARPRPTTATGPNPESARRPRFVPEGMYVDPGFEREEASTTRLNGATVASR